MKTLASFVILLALLAQNLPAEIRFPDDTFQAADLPAAQAKAAEDGKPLAFVYTDKDTTCGLCQRATTSITDAFRRSAVLVYVRSRGDVPPAVGDVLESRGKYIPKVALFTADLDKSHGLVTYEEIKAEGDRPLRALKRAARVN